MYCRLSLAMCVIDTEAEFVHLGYHCFGTSRFLYLTLRQESELAHLGCNEQHSRTVFTSCRTSTATDTRCSVHSLVCDRFRYGYSVSIGYSARIDVYISACLHNLVVGIAVYYQVFDNGESTASPRFDGDGFAIVELTHMELTGSNSLVGTVRMSVDV